MKRKIIQITSSESANTDLYDSCHTLIALCDDGTLWCLDNLGFSDNEWIKIKSIPQKNIDINDRKK